MKKTTLIRIAFIALFLIFVGIIVFFACTNTQQNQDKAKIKLATPAMEEFLQNKYGMTVELENAIVCHKTESAYEASETTESLDLVTAEFVVDNERYYICADITDKKDIICYDDYQRDEIKNIIVSYMHNIVDSEAIYCHTSIFDVFPQQPYLMQHLGSNNINLINRKIEKFEDLLIDAQDTQNDSQYLSCTIAVYYINSEPIVLTDQQIANFKSMASVALVNLNTTDTLLSVDNLHLNPYYLVPDMNDCVIVGKHLSTYKQDGEIWTYNQSTPYTFDNIYFCFSDNISIEPINIELPNYSVTKAFPIDKYTCVIPTKSIDGFKHIEEYEIVFVDSNKNETIGRINKDFYYFSTAEGGFFSLNNTNGQYDQYEYWYLSKLQ